MKPETTWPNNKVELLTKALKYGKSAQRITKRKLSDMRTEATIGYKTGYEEAVNDLRKMMAVAAITDRKFLSMVTTWIGNFKE